MGPPQKTVTYLCYLYCSNAAADKNTLFQKASFKCFARVFPMLTGQGYQQERQEQETAYRHREGTVSGSQIGHRQNYALVQGFCFQDNTLLIKHVDIHTTNNSIIFQSRQIQTQFKCTFPILCWVQFADKTTLNRFFRELLFYCCCFPYLSFHKSSFNKHPVHDREDKNAQIAISVKIYQKHPAFQEL